MKRLDSATRERIRDAIDSGEELADIAAHFCVAESYVRNVASNMARGGDSYRPSKLRILIECIKLQAKWNDADRQRHLTGRPEPVTIREAVSTHGVRQAQHRMDRRRAGREG